MTTWVDGSIEESIMNGLSAEIQQALRAAGWSPVRRVDTAAWRASFDATGLNMHCAAEAFLSEFGGLLVDLSGTGAGRRWKSFEIDPMLAWSYAEERFTACSGRIRQNVFPVGELNRGYAFLGMDEAAELYLVKDAIASFGRLPGGLENLVADVQPRHIAGRHAE
jgi:SUKH-3 immunity protein of toxin-antitoxin system